MKEINQRHQSSLAKLLAHENITIQHGNFETAFFDVNNRVLGLPIWKDKGKDVYDLLVGHEVGHALFTPEWKPEDFPCPAVYVNVVEDIRIERMIQATYPGLVGPFRRGYDSLLKENFFGVNGKDLSTLTIADRVNLKAKLGTLLQVPFKNDEADIVKLVFSVETWEDTLKAAKALYDFAKEQELKKKKQEAAKAKKAKNPPAPKSEDSNKEKGDEDKTPSTQEAPKADNAKDDSKDEGDDTSSKQKSESSDGEGDDEGNEKIPGSSSPSDEKEQDSEASDTTGQASSPSDDSDTDADAIDSIEITVSEPEVLTDKAFEKAAKTLVDRSRQTLGKTFISDPTTKECFDRVVPFKEVFANRDSTPRYMDSIVTDATGLDPHFISFMADTKKHVAVLVKEFELRKAAFQYSRATTSRTGVLDVNRLHSYKTNDDIFKSISKLADAKNHGMVMIVDYSGSMSGVLPHILKHVITLATFCKAVQIPFEVYSFTGGIAYRNPGYNPQAIGKEGRPEISHTLMCQLLSSDMNKAEYARGIKDLYRRARSGYACGSCEDLGGTPLSEALVIAHKILKEFRSRHPVQKMVTMVLTDGEGQHMSITSNSTYDSKRIRGAFTGYEGDFTLNGRNFTSSLDSTSCLKALIKNLRVTTGTKVIGFFIPTSLTNARNNANSASSNRDLGISPKAQHWNDGLGADYKADKSICIKGGFGYDEYFIVSSGNDLSVEDDDLEINGSMTRSAMAKAFTDFSLSKKANRVFVNKFAEAIS